MSLRTTLSLLAVPLSLATVTGLTSAPPARAFAQGGFAVAHYDLAVASTSDGDSSIEPGERFSFYETVRPAPDSDTPTGLKGTLRASSLLTPNSSSRAYDAGPVGNYESKTPHTARLDPSAPCGAPVPAEIAFSAQEGKGTEAFDIPTGQAGATVTSNVPAYAVIPDNDPKGTAWSAPDSVGMNPIHDLDVGVEIDHSYVGDLAITLTSPAGTTITLANRAGGAGDDFDGTVFDDEANPSITEGSAPFTGRYRPVESLSLFDGEPSSGTWTLKVYDLSAGAEGVLDSWSFVPTFAECDAPAPAPSPQAGASVPGGAAVRGDFNHDGYGDLAIGAPGETVDSSPEAGAVHVLYGAATGLSTAGSQLWTQDSNGVLEVSDSDDLFGSALATGDFDGDGFADLAIGVPGEDKGAGAVNVLRGTPAGLTGTNSPLWSQGSPGMLDEPQDGDHFGAALAAGDFGGSALTDLAIGVPDEDATAGAADVGEVQRLAGSPSGLTATGNQLFGQATTGVADDPEAGDRFGAAIAAGDLGWTGQADLAVGVPGEDVAGLGTDHGAVQVLPGAAGGLTATGSQRWTQDSAGVADAIEAGDQFGSALAIANFGGTATRDLAIGVPEEDLGALDDAGAVQVLPGSASGPTATGSSRWTQDSAGIADAAETGDRFGAALAAADFGGTAQGDLAVGAPGESVGSVAEAGAVHVLAGASNGLAAAQSKRFVQGSAGMGGVAETGDHFGSALTAANYGNDARADLAIGVPDEGYPGAEAGGIVQVLPGSPSGVGTAGAKLFSKATAGIAGSPQPFDHFGGGLGR
ncbi:MAG TPA: proprotein convertase P-domain-containing protein [Solirubrobacteraceae bacterium]|jgi:subtilisin-like proprotein convertase family protein